MTVGWDEHLLKATLRRIRLWAGDHPILYTVLFGLMALAVQAAITNGLWQMGNAWAGVFSLLIVPLVIVGFALVRTMLDMLYEVRHALGEQLDPTQAVAVPENFTCELVAGAEREVAIRVTNNDVAGDFQAKIIDLRGVEKNPAPISVRWRGDESIASQRIGSGEFDVLNVVRIRGRRALDFLEPRVGDDDAYCRVVANGTGDRVRVDRASEREGRSHQVEAVVRVVNRSANGEGGRSHLLKLCFENGTDLPTSELVPLVPQD